MRAWYLSFFLGVSSRSGTDRKERSMTLSMQKVAIITSQPLEEKDRKVREGEEGAAGGVPTLSSHILRI